ncbi:hypothetical protein [Synechococcus sp. PCC 6312]|uniref:hypothetical protein n=1 Tax=Synechococcus sp. (strain ATCC 27167 / PCC 6312) TaxID=195253 RepID=UPI00029F3451|nr:hypothetical protein [Synechococcus sp. PCC 6312]AFY61968.1 hypothetical protein Syn6312_2905 [Synechococcus sp. PCC 6312]
MLKTLSLSLFWVFLPLVALAQPTKFMNPTTNRSEVNITGFSPGQEVTVELQGVTKTVRGSCSVGSDIYALLSSDGIGEFQEPFNAYLAATGNQPEIRRGGVNLGNLLDVEPIYNGRCSFVNGARVLMGVYGTERMTVIPQSQINGVDLLMFTPVDQNDNPVPGSKRQLWVRVPNWELTPIQIVGGFLERKYKANNCGIVRFAETATSPLPETFKLASTVYQVSNLSTAYPPKCYKTGETSYTLFVPAN